MSKTAKIVGLLILVLLIGGAVYYFVIKGPSKKTSETRGEYVARRTGDYKNSPLSIAAAKAAGALPQNPTDEQLTNWAAQQANWEADNKQL